MISGYVLYNLYQELFATDGATSVYSAAAEICKNDDRVSFLFIYPYMYIVSGVWYSDTCVFRSPESLRWLLLHHVWIGYCRTITSSQELLGQVRRQEEVILG